jgi:hypothetical protein
VTDSYRTRARVAVFSIDPTEEARLLEIRDIPGERVRLIARARIGDPLLPLHPAELQWLREALTPTSQLPWLAPAEWDALARSLAWAIRDIHVLDARREWERSAALRALPDLVAESREPETALHEVDEEGGEP